MVKGWFNSPGRDGARSLEEQMLGLVPAIAETAGKSVLDLGPAEGLIAMEFAKAGAASVYGIELNAEMVEVARAELAENLLPVAIDRGNIAKWIAAAARPQYDIVLALAILHKLPDPEAAIRYCAESARSLIVVRLQMGSVGVVRAKHTNRSADMRYILPEYGFTRERKEAGPRGEWVQYWRRAC